jgi:hypothetical protein
MQLVEAYAAECSVPSVGMINPEVDMYSALEQAGVSRCFGVFAADVMVGFSNVLHTILPHYSRKVAVVESIFLGKDQRPGGSGLDLMEAIENDARESGCVAILYSAPVESRFARLLAVRPQYVGTSMVYCRSLA